MTSDAHAVGAGTVAQISLLVRDQARAEAFYGDVLGLPHLFTFGALSFFDLDGIRLYLHTADEGEWRPGSVVYFLVDDIAAAHAILESKAVKTLGVPHLVFTDDAAGVEEWMAFFEDSEGNMLALLARIPTKA